MPISLTPLPHELFDEWRHETRARQIALRHDSGRLLGDDASAQVDTVFAEVMPQGLATPTSRVLQIFDGERPLGTIWVAVAAGKLFLLDLAFEADAAPQRDELFAAVVAVAREAGAGRITLGLYPTDAAGRAFIDGRGFTLASIQMVLEPLPERDVAAHVDVAPMTAERFPSFAAASEAAFAEDLVASGRYVAADALAESHRQMQLELPDGVESAGQHLFTASVDGVEVGILWLGMRSRAGRPHVFVLDIEVADGQRRKGYGRELMHAAEREAKRLGAGSIGLHVFGFNTGAIDLYEQLGYRRVEEAYFLDL